VGFFVSVIYLFKTINESSIMGEWSDYFEDFPEEDLGNYINGQFSPELARQGKCN